MSITTDQLNDAALDTLTALCSAYSRLSRDKLNIEHSMSELRPAIIEMATTLNVQSLDGDGWTLSKCKGRKTFDVKGFIQSLVESGVELGLVNKLCEKAKRVSGDYYKVSPKKGE